MKKNLIGFGITILGGVLTAVTEFMPFAILIFIGVFLFASLPEEVWFADYVIANSNEALVRKRHYMAFLPFTIISQILTLGKAILLIPCKEEYFRSVIDAEGNLQHNPIPRAEYLALRNQQRLIYSTQLLSKDFMTKSYSLEDIGLKRKKRRLIIVCVLAALMLTSLVEPSEIYIALIYEALFIPMILLWIPEYKDAKILHQAYERSVINNATTAE